MNHSSGAPDDMLMNRNHAQVRDAVAPDHTQQHNGQPRDEQRAQRLARVYRYLLARAVELEAAEQKSQVTTPVTEADITGQADNILIARLPS